MQLERRKPGQNVHALFVPAVRTQTDNHAGLDRRSLTSPCRCVAVLFHHSVFQYRIQIYPATNRGLDQLVAFRTDRQNIVSIQRQFRVLCYRLPVVPLFRWPLPTPLAHRPLPFDCPHQRHPLPPATNSASRLVLGSTCRAGIRGAILLPVTGCFRLVLWSALGHCSVVADFA